MSAGLECASAAATSSVLPCRPTRQNPCVQEYIIFLTPQNHPRKVFPKMHPQTTSKEFFPSPDLSKIIFLFKFTNASKNHWKCLPCDTLAAYPPEFVCPETPQKTLPQKIFRLCCKTTYSVLLDQPTNPNICV